MELHFYYDIVCPYAYLAAQRIGTLGVSPEVEVVWSPVLLGGVLRAVGAPDDPNQQQVPARQRATRDDIQWQSERAGLYLRFPPQHPRRTVDAMRLLVATPEAFRPALSLDLFRAYWEQGRDLADPVVLQQVAGRHGLDARVVGEPAIRDALREATDDAVAHGVFGVPTFRVGERLWWGSDRLQMVAEHVGATPAMSTWMDAQAPAKVSYYYDLASPFSYLADTQIDGICREHGARLERVPVLLGGLFKALGGPMVPLSAMNARRRAYQLQDLKDWAHWWDVPFQFNKHFPLHTVLAQRVSLVAPDTTPLLFAAAWREGRDLGDPEVLREVLTDAGFDAAALLTRANTPQIKSQLRSNTDRALAAGVFGAPSFVVDDRWLLWGQDRLELLEAMLRGWRPSH